MPRLGGTTFVLLATFLGAETKAERYPRPQLLLEAAELAKPGVADKFRILDVRDKSRYEAGHIPGAVRVDPADWAKAFAAGQDPAEWGKRLGDLGIDVTTPVVAYDDKASRDAARIWWILRFWGVEDVRLLNGGWKAWQERGGKTSHEERKPVPVKPRLKPQSARLTVKSQLLDRVKQGDPQIVDARSPGEYQGTTKTARRNGAVPGAVHLEWSDLLDPQTQRFKSREELARLFRERNLDLDHPTVCYCQSGGRASVLAFALELLGAKDVRNYYRSWAEWGNADDTPIEQPKKGR